jgi:small subunit ribosomal protein S17
MEKIQKARKKLLGEVTAVDSGKTLKVCVERKMTHPLYKKIIKSHKNYLVNYTGSEIVVGDNVMIEEGRPTSKKKCFNLLKKIK